MFNSHYIWVAVGGVAPVSLILTWAFRRFALARRMIDIPNERSSHTSPTPRGGGVAIVISFLSGLTVLEIAGFLPAYLFRALLGAGVWVALIGWLDDRGNIPAGIRLAGHFIAAGWVILLIGGLPQISAFGLELGPGIAGGVLAAVYLVWMLNLYNFMDGIDGIAGIEALTVCAGAVVLWLLRPVAHDVLLGPALLAGATAGFLFWNFPWARIFMGDAGSGFLGIVMGVLSLRAGWAAPELFWGWVILLGAFVADATVTLLRRARRGEKLHQAHRTHAYQHAARKYGAHWPVAAAYGIINIFWLLPMAALVVTGIIDGVVGAAIAYTPLIGAACWFGAGVEMNR